MKESYDCDCGICSICNGLRRPGESHADAALRRGEVPSASTNMPRDEIRLLAESIVSCINGGKYDNAKVLAESIIAELSPVG